MHIVLTKSGKLYRNDKNPSIDKSDLFETITMIPVSYDCDPKSPDPIVDFEHDGWLYARTQQGKLWYLGTNLEKPLQLLETNMIDWVIRAGRDMLTHTSPEIELNIFKMFKRYGVSVESLRGMGFSAETLASEPSSSTTVVTQDHGSAVRQILVVNRDKLIVLSNTGKIFSVKPGIGYRSPMIKPMIEL